MDLDSHRWILLHDGIWSVVWNCKSSTSSQSRGCTNLSANDPTGACRTFLLQSPSPQYQMQKLDPWMHFYDKILLLWNFLLWKIPPLLQSFYQLTVILSVNLPGILNFNVWIFNDDSNSKSFFAGFLDHRPEVYLPCHWLLDPDHASNDKMVLWLRKRAQFPMTSNRRSSSSSTQEPDLITLEHKMPEWILFSDC